MNKSASLFENIQWSIELNQTIDPENSSFWYLILALLWLMIWIIFLTFYLSKISGLIVSVLLNSYLRLSKTAGHVRIGSFSISLLGGKIMFKDFVFANSDYSIRCNDGWIIYSYWRQVPGRNINFKDNTSRLHLSLNGFQLHWFNRLARYKEISKLFGMERFFGDEDIKRPAAMDTTSPPPGSWERFWALVGVIKLDIWSGRVVVGNQILPYMLVMSWENMQSKVRLCESAADRALLSIEGHMESVKASFLKHPDYQGKAYKDPPRTMGDGFAILQTASLNFFYHQDMLGFVTDTEQSPDRDRPVWESVFRFGANTVISYGPWAEQQRALLNAFFFPPDYQKAAVSELPKQRHRRIHIMHDVRMSFLKGSAIDLWFMRGDQLESVQTRCQQGSTVDLSIWWITREDGFSWTMKTSLLKVASTTSLVYRKLFECETLRIESKFHYPNVFNAKQTWTFNYSITKATMWFVWDHKKFFTDLITEWMGDAPPDLLAFIPYTVSTDLQVTDGFEVILLVNENNWVDPSETQSENVEAAIVGEKLTLSVLMSFLDFMPETISVKYSLAGENEMALRMRYPPNSYTAPLLSALWSAAQTTSHAMPSPHGNTSKQDGWYEMWRTERVSTVFDFTYHPIVAEFRPAIPTALLNEWLPKKVTHPTELTPDNLGVVIDIEGSEIKLTGLLIKFLIEMKNNYFGNYDSMTDINAADSATGPAGSVFDRVPPHTPPEFYRPLDVAVELRVHNIRAQCLIYSSTNSELCPVVYTEEIAVEIKKSCKETLIQVGVGKCAAHFERHSSNQADGFLSLSGLQFRGMAMFSHVDVPWDMGILEYGWVMEILVGEVNGSLELPMHLTALHQLLETLLIMAISKDDEKVVPSRFHFCQHGQPMTSCKKSPLPRGICEGEERLKYRQLRVSVDGIHLALCEDKTIINTVVDPIRFTLCNAHEGRFAENICVRVPSIEIRQVLRQPNSENEWLQVARCSIKKVALDIELPLSEADSQGDRVRSRCAFMKKHDEATRRLHFLWDTNAVWGCTCYGTTNFFGPTDLIGLSFLQNLTQKLFVPAIQPADKQLGVLQDLLRPKEMMLHDDPHYIYCCPRKASVESNVASGVHSQDTGSFHSALSHQKEGRPSASRPLMHEYSNYLSKVDVIRHHSEPPRFGDPGAISLWAQKKTVHLNTTQVGVDTVRMRLSTEKGEARITDAIEAAPVAKMTLNRLAGNRLSIHGSVANSVELFVTPLCIETTERIVSSLTTWLRMVHPAFLLQTTYRECMMKSHRQPLNESLFATGAAAPVQLDVSLDMPRIHLAMFQCGSVDGRAPERSQSESALATPFSSNLALILMDEASITTDTIVDAGLGGTVFVFHCPIVSSQLLQFMPKSEHDFHADFTKIPLKTRVEWKDTGIDRRLADKDLRTVADLQIPDVMVKLERKNKADRTSSVLAVNGVPPQLHGNKSKHENKTKFEFGSMRVLLVMARPLERTAKDEFPFYNVLSPAITAWLSVAKRLDAAVAHLGESWAAWSDMKVARVMKLALDSTDDTFMTPKGKNLMEQVKQLGRHQASCPTCLLLQILMRWCSLPSSDDSVRAPLELHSGFRQEKQRKTALRALLSHWHPDICRIVKLSSSADARKYRADPGDKKSKGSGETRITVDAPPPEPERPVMTHRRTESGVSRNLTTADGTLPGGANNQKRPSEAEPKYNLYQWIANAHRERHERKEGKKGLEGAEKDYVNPMDILPQAFFYSMYRLRRLDWTQLDAVPLNQLKMSYELSVLGLAVDLVEPKLIAAAEATTMLFSCQFLHHLVQVKRIAVKGDVSWVIEMDDKNLMPVRGKASLEYHGSVADIQFVAALSSVCLAKEMVLVVKTASDVLAELSKETAELPLQPRAVDTPPAMSPVSPLRPASPASLTDAREGGFSAWDEKVLNLMTDFEKNAQRSTSGRRGDVLTSIRGFVSVEGVQLVSNLTDLYVSFEMKTIEMTQQHKPGTRDSVPDEVDLLRLSLRKAKLNIRESVREVMSETGRPRAINESKNILICGLKESSATLDRKLLPSVAGSAKWDTSLSIGLGAIEGELPMAAHSLHDVVMRHGPQLEQQFNRLSAQPQNLLATPPGETAKKVPVVAKSASQDRRPTGERSLSLSRKAMAPIAKIAFKLSVESIDLQARLLPSLLVIYRMNKASSHGETGPEAKLSAVIGDHRANFSVTPQNRATDEFTLALPSISVKGQYLGEGTDKKTADGRGAPTTADKQVHYREGGYLKMEVLFGQVNHAFTTDLLNHILFAEQSFRTELSSLVQRLSRERPDYASTTIRRNEAEGERDKQPFLFFLTVRGTGTPWLQLTAATPTSTAVRFTIDSLETELTNRWVVKEEGSKRERLLGAAVIQFNAKLGQLVKLAQYEEIQPELQEYATFMTQIRVENKESSHQSSYSYHIGLNRPILLLKASAIDKAILLWLNYKNTYDYWRAERSKFERAASRDRNNAVAPAVFSPQPSQDFDINLSLAINNGMYVCMPLVSYDVTDGMPALVLSLQKSDVTVTIKKELACQAQFHGFKLAFLDNFDEQSLGTFHETVGAHSNFFFFPQGAYKLCSKASNDSGDAQWVLSVRSHMRGVVIDLDHRIGKLTKMLVNTLSSLGEDDQELYEGDHVDFVPDSEEDLLEGGAELAQLLPEERVRWMEQKMHEKSQLVADLVLRKADEKTLETERKKLRQFELIRFKEFRRSMMEKLRRKNDNQQQQKNKISGGSTDSLPMSTGRLTPSVPAFKMDSSDGEGGRAQTTNTPKTPPQDTVNMHIDVQVSIESGTCTVRTAPKGGDSVATGTGPSGGPMVKRPSAKDLRAKPMMQQTTNTTKFIIPSVDLKGYYVSQQNQQGPPASHPIYQQMRSTAAAGAGREQRANKRGCFYLSVALSSMPTETVVTPHLADYLEQVLEPLPPTVGVRSESVHSVSVEPEPLNNIVAIDTSVLPIDVLFYFTVQSSTIRFDGQQQRSSAADCLLKLPCLTLMASTRRTDGAEYLGGVDISITLNAFSLSIYSPHQQTSSHDALSLNLDHVSLVISRSKNSSVELDNRVRFVLTANIGTANFNYDMRRLNELMAFPKPWYRRTIARRVFFGDQSGAARDVAQSKPSTIASQVVSTRPPVVQNKPWSATVHLAVQWKELNVNAQMSNTMGTTSWKARKGLLRASAKLNSLHERDMTVSFRLDSSELTAHGGAISGEIALSKLAATATHRRKQKRPPVNRAELELQNVAARVEWMSHAVLIARCERPSIVMGDDFAETRDKNGEVTRASVSLNVKAAWDDLQLVITRSTLDDFQKIVNKLNAFFLEQLNNSKMAWRFAEEPGSAVNAEEKSTDSTEGDETQPWATAHWEKVLDTVTDIQYSLQQFALPRTGETIVGGSVELEAGRFSLACMHGDMIATSWAVFHLRNPAILFSPEAQFHYVNRETASVGVSVRQRLVIRLGKVPTSSEAAQTENMGNVSRVQQDRNSVMRQNSTIGASLDYLVGDVLKQIGLAGGGQAATATPTGPALTKTKHHVLELFQFPALEAVFTSLQSSECDPTEEIIPEVHASMLCEFHNSLFVQPDFSAQVSFLPELIKNYIKSSDSADMLKAASSGKATAPTAAVPSASTSDRRVYICENWEVQPKIGFNDRKNKWTPPLIDDVLRILQIFDHRTTIPKALQRAVLDPLDAGLANALSQLLRMVDRASGESQENSSASTTSRILK